MKVKRYLVIACVLAGLAGGSALTAQASTAPVSLRGYSCSPNLQPLLRGLDVTAVMRPVTGTLKLRMRFDLLRAARRAGPYRVVRGTNLGRWIGPPNPGLGRQPGDVWQVSHPVVGASKPGYYRLQVAFEWLGAHNQRLAAATRTTPACALLELRPDLLVSRLVSATPIPARPGRNAYVAAIRNRGDTATGPFEIELSVAGGTPVRRMLPGLGAHASRRVRLVDTACTAGQAVTITVDPAQQIPDYDPANNSLTLDCPNAG